MLAVLLCRCDDGCVECAAVAAVAVSSEGRRFLGAVRCCCDDGCVVGGAVRCNRGGGCVEQRRAVPRGGA